MKKESEMNEEGVEQVTYVVIAYFDHEPCRVYGPFVSEDAVADWVENSPMHPDAWVIHELLKGE